jgi:hypothetical protein
MYLNRFLHNKTKQMHYFHKFILARNSTFRTVHPSSGVYSLYTQQWYMSYRFVDNFSVQCTVNKLPMMDRGTVRNMQSFVPKWICEICASSWFYYKEICYNARSHERKILELYIQYTYICTHTHTHTLDNGMIFYSTLLMQLRSCDVLLPVFIHWFSTGTNANPIGKSSQWWCVFHVVLGLNNDKGSIGHTVSLHFLIFNWLSVKRKWISITS